MRSKLTNSFNPQFLKENHQRQFLYPKVREAIIPHNRKNPISKQEKPYLSIFKISTLRLKKCYFSPKHGKGEKPYLEIGFSLLTDMFKYATFALNKIITYKTNSHEKMFSPIDAPCCNGILQPSKA